MHACEQLKPRVSVQRVSTCSIAPVVLEGKHLSVRVHWYTLTVC